MINTSTPTTADQVKAFCARIGVDRLLVQGAGGNVSWKLDDVLWIKASGTWLADAEEKNIFLPVDLIHLKLLIAAQDFYAVPKIVGESNLRPSIETLLHAVMPHKVVLHLHAVEILAHLVRANPAEEFQKLIKNAFKWVCVDYFKPGAELARAVAGQLLKQPDAEVVFLQNHGVVIGAESVEGIELILNRLVSLLKNKTIPCGIDVGPIELEIPSLSGVYTLCKDHELNQLATSSYLSSRLENEWVLYPDQAVFLGRRPTIFERSMDLRSLIPAVDSKAAFIFLIGSGVYESQDATAAQKVQLRCYYDVLIRQPANEKLMALPEVAITALLDWDAEKYRQAECAA